MSRPSTFVYGAPHLCKRCGNTYPWTRDHFHRTGRDRLHGDCKACQTAAVIAIQKRRRQERNTQHAEAMRLAERAKTIVANEQRPDVALDTITAHWGRAA